MGQNLVLNLAAKGYGVSVYNIEDLITKKFIKERATGKKVKDTYSYQELVASLSRPRKVLLLVKAGEAVDLVIGSLLPYLEVGDIIIDGGNSHYADTDRRYKELKRTGIQFLGTGVSGGEFGALHGPAIMPGGDRNTYHRVEEILRAIATRTAQGPCVAYLGKGSAGHFVKMVHNGIEYAVMQLISEVYDLFRKALRISPDRISVIFKNWNQLQQSYLLEITHHILAQKDEETGQALIDLILDRAQQKGTGKWSAQEALELGVPLPTITAAVTARNLSALKKERLVVNSIWGGLREKVLKEQEVLGLLEDALYLSIVIAYAEGMSLLRTASERYNYRLPLEQIALIWQGGCIIRAAFLQAIYQAYLTEPDLTNLILAAGFKKDFRDKSPRLRKVVMLAKEIGLFIPALSAALDYYDGLRSAELPANLIQAQRDYFGAHTYQRKDKKGSYHTDWPR